MAPATAVTVPAAPKHLDDKAKKRWQGSYAKAHAQAQLDYPENKNAQHAAANKEANKMLAVPAPQSAEDIDSLEDWQVLKRETRTAADGSETRHCVTSDGRKYAHPAVKEKKAKAAAATTQPAQ